MNGWWRIPGPLVNRREPIGDVTVATDGAASLELFDRERPDLVLLDLMLPGMPGTDVCKHLPAVSAVPIIMLTAKGSEIDQVVGLEFGADDYITKPFSMPS